MIVSAPSCAKCGACATVCPVYRQSGRESHTARGKLHLLDVLGLVRASTDFVDIFSACLLCGACAAICPRFIDIPKEIIRARNSFSSIAGPHAYEKYLTRKLLDHPGSLSGLRVLGKAGERLIGSYLPERSGLRLRLALFQEESICPPVTAGKKNLPAPSARSRQMSWFPGCAARYLFPGSLASCRSLFADRGVDLVFPDSLVCCGLADLTAGDIDGAQKKGRQNIEFLEKTEGSILVSCASCFSQLQKYPMLFAGDSVWQQRAEQIALRLVELTEFLDDVSVTESVAPKRATRKLRIFYHDPCHMRHNKEVRDRSRTLLGKTGGVEILELEDGPRCCGQGGLFHIAHPEISAAIRDQLVEDVSGLQPDVVTSSCSGCLMQWQQGVTAAGSRVQVLHLSQVLELLKTLKN